MIDDKRTPDFDAIGRRLADRGYFSESGASDIVAALRDVWNARGGADMQAINDRLASMLIGEQYCEHLRAGIRAMDR